MNNITAITIQVVVSLVLVVMIMNGANYIMKQEDIIPDITKRVETKIFSGWVDMASFVNKKYNTHNVFAGNYKPLPMSVNKMGGSQFSYTLWMKLNDVSPENVADKVLFVQGDPTKFAFSTSTGTNTQHGRSELIKCPLVKFGDTAGNLIVEFNTTTDIHARAEINNNSSADAAVRHNMFSLIPGKWVLLTFVFEDDRSYGEHEDGVLFRFYVNDSLYQSKRFSGGLRLNKGDLVIMPSGAISGGYLADFSYFNYALGIKDVQSILSGGVSNKRYNDMDTDPSFNEPLYLSQYNRLEIHNFNK
jgi:hypothetical protein